MNAINIRIEDATVVSKLSALANAHKRSIEAEALELIKSGLASKAPFDRLAAARAISAMTPSDRVQPDSLEMIREDRARDG
ncbi:MAG: hypothetical protein KF914_12580 [Rhizobiaceae bacterium]|nr:hypothetical protein [Rhizobiaceae bacterium]